MIVSEVPNGALKIMEGILMSANTDDVKGRLKEAAGALTGDKKLKREGQVDQAGARVKNAADSARDNVGEVVDSLKERASDAVDSMKDRSDKNREK